VRQCKREKSDKMNKVRYRKVAKEGYISEK
jgi:hypothetical protein